MCNQLERRGFSLGMQQRSSSSVVVVVEVEVDVDVAWCWWKHWRGLTTHKSDSSYSIPIYIEKRGRWSFVPSHMHFEHLVICSWLHNFWSSPGKGWQKSSTRAQVNEDPREREDECRNQKVVVHFVWDWVVVTRGTICEGLDRLCDLFARQMSFRHPLKCPSNLIRNVCYRRCCNWWCWETSTEEAGEEKIICLVKLDLKNM